MIHESSLAKPDKEGLKTLELMILILKYLYLGNTVEYSHRFYRMDGDYNVYIVDLKADYKTPKERGTATPTFVNDMFFSLLTDMASDETILSQVNAMRLEVAMSIALNKEDKKNNDNRR